MEYQVYKLPFIWMKCLNKSYTWRNIGLHFVPICSMWTRVTYYKHCVFLIIKLSIETGHSPQVEIFPSVLNSSTEKVSMDIARTEINTTLFFPALSRFFSHSSWITWQLPQSLHSQSSILHELHHISIRN